MIIIDYLIKKLLRENETSNPIKIAKNLGIEVYFTELGTLNGFFNTYRKQKFIYINCNLTEQQQLFTAAHELGHALLHPKTNTAFLKTHTYMVINKFENEANQFAVNLIISDDDIEEYKHLSFTNIANIYGCSEELIKLRFKTFKVGSR